MTGERRFAQLPRTSKRLVNFLRIDEAENFADETWSITYYCWAEHHARHCALTYVLQNGTLDHTFVGRMPNSRLLNNEDNLVSLAVRS